MNKSGVFYVSALRNYIPPMLIFKIKRMKPELQVGAPVGKIFQSVHRAWMDGLLDIPRLA